jgi:hypothetical protein
MTESIDDSWSGVPDQLTIGRMARARRFLKRRESKIAGAIFITAFILLLPVIVPVALLLDAAYRHRVRAAARWFRCTGCGSVLGLESLRLADAAWAEKMRLLQERHPGIKFQIIRNLHAICAVCGRRYRYQDNNRTFVEEGLAT